MQAHALKFACGKPVSAYAANNPNFHAGLFPFIKQTQHGAIADFGVVDEQFFLRALEELRQLFSRIDRTDQKLAFSCGINLSLCVGFEQLSCLSHQFWVAGYQTETAAVVNVEIGEVESVDIE